MPKINIDEMVEPIEVTVGGKEYVIADIPRDTAKRMGEVGRKAELIEAKIRKAAEDGVDIEVEEDTSTDEMSDILAEILGADKKDMDALGMRKLLKLTTSIMGTLSDENEAKNVPKAAVTK